MGYVFGKREAVAQMGILHKAEDDGGLRVVGVEALIRGLVIVFQKDYGVFSLNKVQVLGIKVISFPGRLTQAVDGIAVGGGAFLYGIHVDGDEQIGIGLVGDDGPVLQLYEDIFRAGHLHLDVRVCGFNLFGEPLADIQGDVFFVRFFIPADTSGIFSAVSRVYYHGGQSHLGRLVLGRHRDCKQKGGAKGQEQGEERLHGKAVLKILE